MSAINKQDVSDLVNMLTSEMNGGAASATSVNQQTAQNIVLSATSANQTDTAVLESKLRSLLADQDGGAKRRKSKKSSKKSSRTVVYNKSF